MPAPAFRNGSFRELVARAGDDAQLALHVGMRHDIPRHHFLKLLETASASVCARIVAANPQFTDAVQEAVTEVIDDINLEIRNQYAGPRQGEVEGEAAPDLA